MRRRLRQHFGTCAGCTWNLRRLYLEPAPFVPGTCAGCTWNLRHLGLGPAPVGSGTCAGWVFEHVKARDLAVFSLFHVLEHLKARDLGHFSLFYVLVWGTSSKCGLDQVQGWPRLRAEAPDGPGFGRFCGQVRARAPGWPGIWRFYGRSRARGVTSSKSRGDLVQQGPGPGPGVGW